MAEDERQIVATAESLLGGSINSERSSYTHATRSPDIILREDIIPGAMQNGRMSNVRRFFCLFVTFDLLLTFLMWLICTMIAGENLESAFMNQVVHYHIKTSLFDIVMAAICRFVVLLLFYALLHLNHWLVIALTTAITCGFLIAKVFLFDWSKCTQPVFQVILILTSFVLPWVEAWFFDIRVLPQEMQARTWIRGMTRSSSLGGKFDGDLFPPARLAPRGGRSPSSSSDPCLTAWDDSATHDRHGSEELGELRPPRRARCAGGRSFSEDERAPLLRGGGSQGDRGFPAKEPIAIFFTPMNSSDSSDSEDDTESVKLGHYMMRASALGSDCQSLLLSDEWRVEAKLSNGDVIYCMDRPKQDKLRKIVGIIDTPATVLIDFLYNDIDTSPSWNKLLRECTKIKSIDENTDIVYQITRPQAAGLIGVRDFVILRHRLQHKNYHIICGKSVRDDALPIRKGVIRAENNLICCAAEKLPNDENRCQFTWILDTNLKGWIPQKVVESSMSDALKIFMKNVREYLADQNQTRPSTSKDL